MKKILAVNIRKQCDTHELFMSVQEDQQKTYAHTTRYFAGGINRFDMSTRILEYEYDQI